MEQQNSFLGYFRRHWKLLIAGTVMLIALLWISQYGFISVQTSGFDSSADITYDLYNQRSKSSKQFTGKSSFTKFLSKGNYQLTLTQGDKNAVLIVQTKGFFRKTTVSTSSGSQVDRRFVGYSPQGCIYATSNSVYSYGCGGSSEVTAHVAANTNQPTYSEKKDLGIGTILGIIETDEGLVAIAQQPAEDDTENAGRPSAYLLNNSSNPTQGVSLSNLSESKQYAIKPYQSGFLLYDPEFKDVWYYPSVSGQPQKISLSRPSNSDMKPLFISTSGSSLVAGYSDKADYENNTNPDGIGEVKNEFIIRSGSQTKSFSFDKQFLDAKLCGSQKLCALEADTQLLYVYDVSSQPKLLYWIDRVNSLISSGENIVIMQDTALVSLGVDAKKGSILFQSKVEQNCGAFTYSSGYLVCITDEKNNSAILKLDERGISDGIDRKVSELSSLSEIKTVSAYGNIIFVIPELGSLVYDESLQDYDYNPVTKDRVSKAINSEIDRLKIDKGKYKIIVSGIP